MKEELVKSPVRFDETEHKYWLGERELFGVTSLLHRQLFKKMYNGVSESVLKKAAEYGSQVHKNIEEYYNEGKHEDDKQVNICKNLLASYGLERLANEYLVSNLRQVASSIDMVTTDYSLIDFKTVSKLDDSYLQYVSWQLSIYAYLFELQNPTKQVGKLYVMWLPKNARQKPKMVELMRKPSELVEELLQCDEIGLPYGSAVTEQKEQMPTEYKNAIEQIWELEKAIKSATDHRKQLVEYLTNEMGKNGIKKFDNELLSITYMEESERVSIDTKLLEIMFPDTYARCQRKSVVKPSIRIKLK